VRRPRTGELLRGLPQGSAAVLRAVLQVADAHEVRVYLVGGPVRDWLLERRVADLDLVVETREGMDATALGAAVTGPAVRATTHERFGTVTLRSEGATVDIATLRRESYAHDGALPSVEVGTLEEDLLRRDFSVNALALPLSAAARSRHTGVIDAAEGLADLEQKRLRVMHPRSFHDDPTRALRAARLGPRLGFSLTRDTRSALRAALREGAFGRVSGDRLRREMTKLFDDASRGLDPTRALRLLHDWHVLGALEPGLVLDPAAGAPLRRLGRAIATEPWPAPRWRPWVSGLALWLAPLAPALRRRALKRLSVRGERAACIVAFPRARDTRLRALSAARGRGAVDAALVGLDEETLHALYAWASPAARRRIARWAEEDRTRRPPLSGNDLVAIGLAGPAVGRALARVRVAWLDGSVAGREEALVLARELSRRSRKQSRSPGQ